MIAKLGVLLGAGADPDPRDSRGWQPKEYLDKWFRSGSPDSEENRALAKNLLAFLESARSE